MELDHDASSDAGLLLLVRGGDLAAMGVLYARHREAGLRVARAVTGDPHLAEDLVATAFERIQLALTRGHGPDDSFRAYLYTVIRRLAVEHGERKSREDDVDDWQPYEAATALVDDTDGSIESQLVAKAFSSLPDRHQAVLWYLDVEGMTPAQAAPIFDLSPNAVSALAVRARDALRDAYVQAHVSDSPVRAACGPTRKRMGAYLRGTLSNRDRTKVDAHLAECDECPSVLHELRDVSGGLRSVFGPLVVGGLGLGIGAAVAFGGGTQSASAAIPAGGAGAPGAAPRHPASTAQKVAIGAVLVLVALIGVTAASAAVGGAANPGIAPAAPPAPPDDDDPVLPMPTDPPASPTLDPTLPPPPERPSTPVTSAPTPVQTSSPPPAAALDIDLSDDGDDGTGTGGRLGTVTIEVRNIDATPITATLRIDLPDGMTFDAARAVRADPVWACDTANCTTQTCIATGVPVGADLNLAIPVAIPFEDLGARPVANLSVTR